MKLTNKYNIPEVFFQAVKNDKYSRGGADYSATSLINSPRMFHLKQRHWHEMEEDVSDRIRSLIGKAVHAILDAANMGNALQEERIHMDVLGKKISGAPDLYESNGLLSDYKTTSVWTAIYQSRTKEWTEQVNIYAYLLNHIGFHISALQVVAIYTDWSKSELKKMPDKYPPSMIQIVPIELWSTDKQKAFIESRVQLMIDSESVPDDELPACTPEEMWQKDDSWAIYKKGGKRPRRVLYSEVAVSEWIAEKHSVDEQKKRKLEEYVVEFRPAIRPRCDGYCGAAPFCNIWKEYSKSKMNEVNDSGE